MRPQIRMEKRVADQFSCKKLLTKLQSAHISLSPLGENAKSTQSKSKSMSCWDQDCVLSNLLFSVLDSSEPLSESESWGQLESRLANSRTKYCAKWRVLRNRLDNWRINFERKLGYPPAVEQCKSPSICYKVCQSQLDRALRWRESEQSVSRAVAN